MTEPHAPENLLPDEPPAPEDGVLDEPNAPVEVKEAALRGHLVIFVGAGASRLKGIRGPSWETLAERALEQVCEKRTDFTFEDAELLRNLSPREQLSIAKDVLGDVLKLDDILDPVATRDSRDKTVYDELLEWGQHCITTNYDYQFDRAKKRLTEVDTHPAAGGGGTQGATNAGRVINILTNAADAWNKYDIDLFQDPEKEQRVIHLHGSLSDPGRMVVSTTDYLVHYSNSVIITFLERLFRARTVLFLGYSLREVEILEQVFRRTGATKEGRTPDQASHFWLYPAFKYQAPIVMRVKNYYIRHCNVCPIPYSVSRHGYEQLRTVIRKWTDQINATAAPLTANIRQIKETFRDE